MPAVSVKPEPVEAGDGAAAAAAAEEVAVVEDGVDGPASKRQRVGEQDDLVGPSDIRHAATHPKFLHSNSTSHQWAFGAIAELIDNAADPDVAAKLLQITAEAMPDGQPALLISDDGNGLDLKGLQKLLSFGYNDKAQLFKDTIGRYGNGFKSGSMRLGKDAMVFTRQRDPGTTMSVGLLSQTFLAKVGAEEVLIPMVSWDKHTGERVSENAQKNIDLLLEHSPLDSEDALKLMLRRLHGSHGTIIVIYNLRTQDDGSLELDFETDPHDIRLRGVGDDAGGKAAKFQRSRSNQPADTDVPIDYSLREYCRILYLEPRMQIELRFQKVRTKRILKTTTRRKTVKYAPRDVAASARPARRPEGYTITFGFQPPGEEHLYGVMLYHHNRLIIPYYRIGVQLQPNKDGLGVLGVIEADFLDPTHNKQDFDDNQAWRRLLASLAEKLNMFWFEDKALRQAEEAEMSEAPVRSKKRLPTVDKRLSAQMSALLTQMWSHAHSEAFKKLVSRRQFPDYYVLIKKPIALEQIKAKIGKGQYRTMGEMQKDVQLMCKNAKTYNQDGSPLYKQAERLEKMMADFAKESGKFESAARGSQYAGGDGTCGDRAISLDDVDGNDGTDEEDEADIWVQCDNVDCQKWRKLPFGTSLGDNDADWFCHMNPDTRYNSCDIPEHKEEEETVKQNHQYKVDPKKQAERLERARQQREEQERAAARELENQKLREQLAMEKLKAAEAQAVSHSQMRQPQQQPQQNGAARATSTSHSGSVIPPQQPLQQPQQRPQPHGATRVARAVGAVRYPQNLQQPSAAAYQQSSQQPNQAAQQMLLQQHMRQKNREQELLQKQQEQQLLQQQAQERQKLQRAQPSADAGTTQNEEISDGLQPQAPSPEDQKQVNGQETGKLSKQEQEQEELNDDIELICETLATIAGRLKTRAMLTQVQTFLDTLSPADDGEDDGDDGENEVDNDNSAVAEANSGTQIEVESGDGMSGTAQASAVLSAEDAKDVDDAEDTEEEWPEGLQNLSAEDWQKEANKVGMELKRFKQIVRKEHEQQEREKIKTARGE